MMQVRPGVPGEVPALMDIAWESFRSFAPVPGEQDLFAGVLTSLATFGGYLRVVERDHALCGFLAGMVAPFKPWADEKCAMEILFFVAPEHRRSRASILLLRDFEIWAKAKGCATMAVSANLPSGGERAGKLYERMGFQPIETAYLKRID